MPLAASISVGLLAGLTQAAAPELSAHWTSATIPAIGVHLLDAEGRAVADVRVQLDGPGGERFDGHTDAEGSLTRVFLPVGHWRVSIESDSGSPHQLWVELLPRQRADLQLVLSTGAAPTEAAFRPPVVAVEEASRGSRTLGVGLRGAPQPSTAGGGPAGRVNRAPQ